MLWEEYTQQYPNRCYSYAQYCHLYQVWAKKQRRSMRQVHKAGDKLFVDYAGQTIPIVNGDTGEIRSAQIFVAVLGASNYTYCEATWTQGLPDWLGNHARTFSSLAELNICIKVLLIDINSRPFKKLKGTRQQWFESLDKPVLAPLPKHAYRYTDIKPVRVHIDYHVQYEDHLYSVPHHLVGEELELHAKGLLIELYFHHQRICSHARKYQPGTTTVAEHMPIRHQKHHQWSAGRLMNWAKDLGDDVLVWVQGQIKRKQHEQQAYRVCLGLLNLSKSYPALRINNACALANRHRLYRLKQIKSILKSNQDQLFGDSKQQLTLLPQAHENIRGPQGFH